MLSNKQKIAVHLLLALMIIQIFHAPLTALAAAGSFDVAIEAGSLATSSARPQIGIIAVLVDEELMNDPASYNGIRDNYPNSLKAATLQERIRRYALDAQKSQPFTKSVILKVKKNEPVENIAYTLEKLYLEGDGTSGEINRLIGIVVVGDVPLPVVNKGGNRFVSLFPYTDFEDKTYVFDAATKDFVPNPEVATPKADIWHGVIKPPVSGQEGNELLAFYFDKNYLYHCKNSVCRADSANFKTFSRKLFFMDLIAEYDLMDKQGFGNYLRYLANLESITYFRYNKHLLSRMMDESSEQQKGGDKSDNDGDGKIDEDPINGVDDDLDGESGSPLIGMADSIDNDGDGEIDEADEGRFGICSGSSAIRDCSIPGVPLMTGNFYNVREGSKYKVADSVDNNNDGFIDEKIDEDDGEAFKGIDNDWDGTVDEDSTDDNDADGDNKTDEDMPGDMNGDGCPGICNEDDDLDSIDSDGDGFPDGYEKEIGSRIGGRNVPTDPKNPSSVPISFSGIIPHKRTDPAPDPNDWIDEGTTYATRGSANDDDEDGRSDEDGTSDNDNDGDGKSDEDSAGGNDEISDESIESFPDIQTKQLIDQLATPYNALFDKFLANINDWSGFTGRWDPSYKVTAGDMEYKRSDVSSVPGLITAKDEYTRKYLKLVNDSLERKMDALAENKSDFNAPQLQSPVAMIKGSKIVASGVQVQKDDISGTYAGKTVNFVNFSQHSNKLYINGKPVDQVTGVSDCTLYRGSDDTPNASVLAILSHLYNVFDPSTDADYAGCIGMNYNYPERCFPDAAKKNVFDVLGAKEVPQVSESLTNYRACFDFKEKTRYEDYVDEVRDYVSEIASLDNEEARADVETPGSAYKSASQIVLADLNTNSDILLEDVDIVIRLSQILPKWGQGDKIDNDNDGTIDETDEGGTQFGIPTGDYQQIGDRVLQGRDTNGDKLPDPVQYTFKGNPFFLTYVKEIKLTVTPELARDSSGRAILVSSFSTHKEPTAATIAAQSAVGQSPVSLPTDNPRFFTFRDKMGVFRKVYYPNIFSATSIEQAMQILEDKEEELQTIAEYNDLDLEIDGSLTSLISGASDVYTTSAKNNLQTANYEKISDAYKWKNMNIDDKHDYVLKTYISPNLNGYTGETHNGYEALYLVGKGTADTLEMNFNADYPETDEDPDFAAALQQQAPAPTSAGEAASGTGTGTTATGAGAAGATGASSGSVREAQEALIEIESINTEGINIFLWFAEIQKWLNDVQNNASSYSVAPACGVSDSPGDYFDQLLAGGDLDGDGVPDDVDTDNTSSDSDGDNIPDGAESTARLGLTADKTVLKAGTADTMRVTVNALAGDGSIIRSDSFTQVELKLTSPQGKTLGTIQSTNPVNLAGGTATFDVASTADSGTFTLTASSPNRANMNSNTLTVKSTMRRIRLVSYATKLNTIFSSGQVSGFVIKDESGKVIAEVNGDTGRVYITDDRFGLVAIPSKAAKAARIGVRETSTEKIIASVFFVAGTNSPVVVDDASVNYMTGFSGMRGTHVKDLSAPDIYGISVTPETARYNAGNAYITRRAGGVTKNIGII